MFQVNDNLKCSFLEQAKAAREERAQEKRREDAVIMIQAYVKGWFTRTRFIKQSISEFDSNVPTVEDDNFIGDGHLKSNTDMFLCFRRFMFVFRKHRDETRFIKMCKYLISTLQTDSTRCSYVALALNKDKVLVWISHIRTILVRCCDYLREIRQEITEENNNMMLYLNMLISFTNSNNWLIMKHPKISILKAGMSQLCSNILGQLVQRDFYEVLKELLTKGLGRVKITLKHASISAILTLSLRPLQSAEFSEKMLVTWLIHILSVGALTLHLEQLAPECLSQIRNLGMFTKCMRLLHHRQTMQTIFGTLEGSFALCLLANLIHMAYMERDGALKEIAYPLCTETITNLLASCQQFVMTKQSNLTHWHPVLGWFAQPMDSNLQPAMVLVKQQLQLLWDYELVNVFLANHLSDLVQNIDHLILLSATSPTTISANGLTMPNANSGSSAVSNLFRKIRDNHQQNRSNSSFAVLRQKTTNGVNTKKLSTTVSSAQAQRVIDVCAMYQHALCTLAQLRLDILTGLCYQNTNFLYHMWLFLCSYGLKQFLSHLITAVQDTSGTASSDVDLNQVPPFQMLQLFCDCMAHYVIILDDMEMYEQQHPFKLADFVVLSNFLNVFLYKAILQVIPDAKIIAQSNFFSSLHTLLVLLYRRDSRRSYTPPKHWLAKDIKVSSFMGDLERRKPSTQFLMQRMPHIIPHDDRVRLFRSYIAKEQSANGLIDSQSGSAQSTLITVYRSRIVEDGYRQLAGLPGRSLKGVIRVRFVNQQGLDEAGIDQDGVFKEFLEESMKRVFDPALNLFKATSDERLYPSPTSHLQDSHLQLFEFVGRLLGKAVYEGIVVDVPFASFFLSQVSGQANVQALYSCVDELPSLDESLYRSLSYIKHYESDVSDLDLTFSVDEDSMGQIITHELLPGGKAIPVTNENKISYIHLMAHFRMHVQIKEQTAAFIRGFRSIINPEWLTLFSTPELQRLISGDNVPLDIKDLRRHTQYYGGFHDSHRVMGWLWDILEKDFSEDERRQFLKFVTSCSKPPLLGFAHLEPPFSIRCIEVADDDDTGDTIGSVFRGFFTIRKKEPQNRLPTSSTCFNLLKLPNYQKKSTLREKLRYAVSCNTGFELS